MKYQIYIDIYSYVFLIIIYLDPSFYSISEHTLAELSLPLSPAPEVDLEASENKLDNYVPPFKLHETAGARVKSHGFTLVGDSGQNVTLGNRLRTTAELFDIISNNGDVDHPLCEECTDTLLETMDQQLKVRPHSYFLLTSLVFRSSAFDK